MAAAGGPPTPAQAAELERLGRELSVLGWIDFALIAGQPWLILGLTAGIMAIKLGVLGLLARVFGLSLDQGLLLSLL